MKNKKRNFNMKKNSGRRAFEIFKNACNNGYRSDYYKVVDDLIYLKNDFDKAVVFNTIYEAYNSILLKNIGDQHPILTFLDKLKDGLYRVVL